MAMPVMMVMPMTPGFSVALIAARAMTALLLALEPQARPPRPCRIRIRIVAIGRGCWLDVISRCRRLSLLLV
jgi:hypothetical protein